MIRAMTKIASAVFAVSLFAAGSYASPVALSEAQMDSIAAGGDGFVCPVITTENVLHSPKSGELGIEGFYTIGGPDVTVPTHATNGDGAGSPRGPFSQPGDTDYTAIWSR